MTQQARATGVSRERAAGMESAEDYLSVIAQGKAQSDSRSIMFMIIKELKEL